MTSRNAFGRRGLLGLVASGVAALALPFKADALTAGPVSWQDHFDTIENGAMLADTRARTLHVWGGNGTIHRLYPIAAPAGPALHWRGRAQIVRKVVGPTWRPAPELAARVPELPGVIPPGPDNPLGSHALYLDWQGFRIHGRGENSALRHPDDGISLSNDHIAELFPLARIGMPVKVL